ncbi:UDP-glucuronosyltransferase 2B7 [Anoplophora glabripennis]|uniref:UDP-glucuronosyltransferase 2B7 n=1 Tax=Anoplophora glabripennis TaxID=217634 RepID=UPI000875621D|nr:UDP-glucuronosyltransferase 2B7 [Anoplophora glabripennis]
MIVHVWCILFLIFGARGSHGGNILILIDLPSPSHQLWHYAIAEALIEKGHNVTLLGPFSDKQQKSEMYHPIVIEDVMKELEKSEDLNIEESFMNKNVISIMKTFFDFSCLICSHSYHSKGFHTLLNYPSDFKFDLIIIDMSMSACFYPFIQKFKYPPTIGTTAFLLPPHLSGVFGNELHPSYIPFYHLQFTEDMSFFERVVNYVVTYANYLTETYLKNELEKLARETFPDMNSMQTLERHISLLLCNLNFVVNQPQSVTSNIIPVGGLHIKPSKKLPTDLQTIMDDAKDGVILFCLGTNARSDKLGTGIIQSLLKAFGQLKQTVIWKFESGLENVPKNVVIRQWLPQGSILSHPNTRLFISHGGALSTQEAAYFGIPVIGMPFFIDQRITVNDIVKRKLGLRMDSQSVTTQLVLDNVNEILKNPTYSNNMKEISKRMRDQQNTPLETAVFWSEYAMRHNGTNFLSPRSRDMSFFVASSTDVQLFLLFLLFAFIYLSFLGLKKSVSVVSSISKKKDKLH